MAAMAKGKAKQHSNPLAGVRNWDAQSRITTKWEGLHSDVRLWFPDGDLFVFLFEQGQSQRKPSFHVRMSDLRTRQFEDLAEHCIVSKTVSQPPSNTKAHASTLRARMAGRKTFYELYLPAPQDLDNFSALEYHLTTRNFFAWLYDVPMVGKSLGRSLVAVMERMNEYRPYIEQNRVDLMTYLESQGYYDFRMCADHSLAAIHLAETFEMPNVWKNAFAHCVGMYDLLRDSSEYENISHVTQGMMTKANTNMERNMVAVTDSLGSFFEEFTAASGMGLGAAARDHMDRFRSFLITVHIERHGFWPPRSIARQDSNFPKDILMSLYREFRCLYQFLVDPNLPGDALRRRARLPGIDVEQVTQIFDQKHGFEPLPHCMPLLPRSPGDILDDEEDGGPMSASSLRRKSNGWWKNKPDRVQTRKALWKTLANATNYEPQIYATLIVKRYIEFEREMLIELEEDKFRLSLADGRRVRWLLVYGILQVLISVLKAPSDVSDLDGVEYPLCCKIPSQLPWSLNGTESISDFGSRTMDSSTQSVISASSKSVKSNLDRDGGFQRLQTPGSSASINSNSQISEISQTSVASSNANDKSPAARSRVSQYNQKSATKAKNSKPKSLLRFLGRNPDSSPPEHRAAEETNAGVKRTVIEIDPAASSSDPPSSDTSTSDSASTTPSSAIEEVAPRFPLPPSKEVSGSSELRAPTQPASDGVFTGNLASGIAKAATGTTIVRRRSSRTIRPGDEAEHEREPSRSRASSFTQKLTSYYRPVKPETTSQQPVLHVQTTGLANQQGRRSQSQPPVVGLPPHLMRGALQSSSQERLATSQARSSPTQLQHDINNAFHRTRSTSRGRVSLAPAHSYKSVTSSESTIRPDHQSSLANAEAPRASSVSRTSAFRPVPSTDTQSAESATLQQLLHNWKLQHDADEKQNYAGSATPTLPQRSSNRFSIAADLQYQQQTSPSTSGIPPRAPTSNIPSSPAASPNGPPHPQTPQNRLIIQGINPTTNTANRILPQKDWPMNRSQRPALNRRNSSSSATSYRSNLETLHDRPEESQGRSAIESGFEEERRGRGRTMVR